MFPAAVVTAVVVQVVVPIRTPGPSEFTNPSYVHVSAGFGSLYCCVLSPAVIVSGAPAIE